jgi:hypothetical protein
MIASNLNRNQAPPHPGALGRLRQEKSASRAAVRPAQGGVFESRFWMLAVLTCAAAIACVPVFSHRVGFSHLTQLVALAAMGMAGLTVFKCLPRFHPAMIAYCLLVAFWGLSIVPESMQGYTTLVKLTILAMAVHMVIRTPKHLLVFLGIYTMSGVIALAMNWNDIANIRYMMGDMTFQADRLRLDGTFANANTAGIFALTVTVFSLIIFFTTQHRIRWFLLASSLMVAVLIGGLSGSRKVFVGLIIVGLSAPLIALAGAGRQVFVSALKATVVGAVGLMAILLAATQLPQFERLSRITEGVSADGSLQTRWDMARDTVVVWQRFPIAGAGFQGYSRVSTEFPGRYSHTTFGEILANAGLVGMLLMATFYGLPAFQLVILFRRSPDPNIRRLAVGLLVFWSVFVMNSAFTVLYDSKDLIPIWAAICGWLNYRRSHMLRPPVRHRLNHREQANPLMPTTAGAAGAFQRIP